MTTSRAPRYLTLLPMAAAYGCGLLAPSDAELMGGTTPGGDSGAVVPPGSSPPGSSPPGTSPPGITPPGSNGDGGAVVPDASTNPQCESICAVVPESCRASPNCFCLFSGTSCSQTSCSSQNGEITATCGSTTCTVDGDGKLVCLKSAVACPCN